MCNQRIIEQEARRRNVTLTQEEIQDQVNDILKKSNAASVDELLSKFKTTHEKLMFSVENRAKAEKLAKADGKDNDLASWFNDLQAKASIDNHLLAQDTASLDAAIKGADSFTVAIVNGENICKRDLTSTLWFWNAPGTLQDILSQKMIEQAAKKAKISLSDAELKNKIDHDVSQTGLKTMDEVRSSVS